MAAIFDALVSALIMTKNSVSSGLAGVSERVIGQNIGYGTAASGFRACGSDDNSGDAGLYACAGTHLAGLERYVHRAILESPVAQL